MMRSRSRGNILVSVVVAMGVLLGSSALIFDLGLGYMARSDIQKAVDAAALAGAESLPDSPTARQVALETALANYPEGQYDVTDVTQSYLRIQGEITVDYSMAAFIGVESSLVRAVGRARIEFPSAVRDVVPWGIQDQTLVYGVQYTLKYGPRSGAQLPQQGNFGALALGGTGANNYRDNIKYGYHGLLYIGQWVDTEPGNMSGPTEDGVYYRINQDPCSNYLTVDKYSPRLVTVPIITSYDDVHGRDEVQIAGFALFFLEGVGGHGNDNYVYGRFLERVRPTVESDPDAPNYGMRDVKLYAGDEEE